MKSLFLALLFFGVVAYGCYDVTPYRRALKRAIRRTPRAEGLEETGPLRPAGRMAPEPPQRRRHYQ